MARLTRLKKVRGRPRFAEFVAKGSREEYGLTLTLEEWEALRLVDYLAEEHLEAAESMGVSRQTLQMLLRSARQKSARALVEGLTLRIGGGHYELENISEIQKGMRNTSMKIAVTSMNGHVFAHFGRTPEFAIFKSEDGKIVKEEVLAAPAEGHGALASFLKQAGVDILICGGIGGGAINALRAAGIEVYAGAAGEVRQQAESLLAGQLPQQGDANCDHHGEGHHHGHGADGGCSHHQHGCADHEGPVIQI